MNFNVPGSFKSIRSLIMKNIWLGLCSKCNSWGLAPANFRQSKHFLKCPKCESPMYLTYTNEKEMETFYGKTNRVEDVGVMLHGDS